MNLTEIIVSEKQSNRSFQVFALLAKRIGQTGETSHLHPYSKILPFNMASADVVTCRLREDGSSYTVHELRRGIAMLVTLMHSINLYYLREVYALVSEFVRDRIAVGCKAISCYLKLLIPCCAVELLCKCPSIIKR